MRLMILTMAALIGCATPETTRQAPVGLMALPQMNTFAPRAHSAPRLSNALIGRDFMDLAFRLENDADLLTLTRFEGPISIRIAGDPPPTLARDLDRLVTRLRREAGIDIAIAKAGTASIMVQPVPRQQILDVAPSAACFVRPNVSSWREYRSRRRDPTTFWPRLKERKRMAVFLPSDVSPQEMRDCLHEEVAQALGPVNDLYRLGQSVFNDDNFHTVLSGYDMLILRAYYDDALVNGMSRIEVANRLPEILARINPHGGRRAIAAPERESVAWKSAINRATNPSTSRTGRTNAARRAVTLARAAGHTDTRLAFSLYVLGRMTLASDPEAALNAFLSARRIYRARPETGIQQAHVALQIAAFQLSTGDASAALNTAEDAIPAVRRAEHAALLSLFLLMKSEAQKALGDAQGSATSEAEALGWARYGFGSEREIRARISEIRAISPGAPRGGNT